MPLKWPDFPAMFAQGQVGPCWLAAGLAHLVLLIALLSPWQAMAQGAAASQNGDDEAQAKAIFAAGRDAYGKGRFVEAVESFERVFRMTGYPMMLINIGNAWSRAGESARAVGAYRQYLLLVPDAEEAEELEARIEELSLRPERPQPQAEEAEPPEPSGLYLGRTWTWAAAGGTVLLMSSALAVWIGADSRYEALSATCGKTPEGCSGSEIDAVDTRVTVTNVLWVLSALGAAGTGALWYFEGLEQAPPPPGLEVEVTATGLTLRGTF